MPHSRWGKPHCTPAFLQDSHKARDKKELQVPRGVSAPQKDHFSSGNWFQTYFVMISNLDHSRMLRKIMAPPPVAGDVPACCRDLGLDGLYKSLPTQATP